MLRVIKNSNWWHGRTKAERFLLLVSILASIAVNRLVSGNVLNSNPMANELTCPKELSNICLTPECIHTAASVLKYLKPSIKPCDNFYEFACGTFLDEAEIPNNTNKVNPNLNLVHKISKQLKDIITEDRPEMDPKYLKLPNTLYKACMNTTLIETLDYKPMHQVAKKLGGWPVIVGESWNNDNLWSWQDTIRRCRILGVDTNSIIKVWSSINIFADKKQTIHVRKPSLGLLQEHWSKKPLVKAYYNYMIDVAVLFGANRKKAKYELQKSLEFERKLANINLPNDSDFLYKSEYNLRIIKEVQKDYDYVQWLDYINALLPEGSTVNGNEVINFMDFYYFDGLGKLLQETEERTIANYMMWRIYESMLPYLSKKFRNIKLRYDSGNSVRDEDWKRSKKCIDIVTGGNEKVQNSLGIAMGSLFIRKYFDGDSKDIALSMINSIRDNFVQMVDKTWWLNDDTPIKNLLQSIKPDIDFPDELLDNDKLEEYYRKLNINSDTFFESILSMNVMDTDYSFNKSPPLEQKNEWIKYGRPFDAKHFYSQTDNRLHFSAVLWQDVFFNRHRPMYMNYGSIGSRIGHEFALSLDDIDERMDVLWSRESLGIFYRDAACIVHKYDEYIDKITGRKISGTFTRRTNMADNIGFRQAYLTYTRWAENNTAELQLPGLNFTPQQMFWISTAQTMCTKITKDYAFKRSVHNTPAEYRVLGSFGNIEEFLSDFKCPMDSPMYPQRFCRFYQQYW